MRSMLSTRTADVGVHRAGGVSETDAAGDRNRLIAPERDASAT
jgi:hypothetical protein